MLHNEKADERIAKLIREDKKKQAVTAYIEKLKELKRLALLTSEITILREELKPRNQERAKLLKSLKAKINEFEKYWEKDNA